MNELVQFGLSFQEARALMDEVRRDERRGRGKPRGRGKVAR
jgi:hypothetical protein